MTAHFGELRQVISNLMLNSIDAIEDFGKLTVPCHPAPSLRGWKDSNSYQRRG